MKAMELTEIRTIVAVLEDFLAESKPGESRDILEYEGESIFATNLDNEAVLVRYATCGDWTRAVVIPSENFPHGEDWEDQYSPADEAVEWFFTL